MPTLDLTFVRSQFPAFSEPTLRNTVFCENAGGSYTAGTVIDRLGEYYRRLKVQPYYAYPAAEEAGQWMDAAYAALAPYLGVTADHLHFGPSTSQNTYVLAQAFRALLQPGDEIIVTNQDHEANSGAWRRLAGFGIAVREWRVDPASGLLDPDALVALLTERTRLVAFPHCSNLLAHLNPVQRICGLLREAGVISVVDGVSYAPHGLPDVAALGADLYLFSLYKTFGPHQGLMVVRPALAGRLANQGHGFNAGQPRKRLVPAGADHAQVAAARGVAEYFEALDVHHGGGDVAGRPARVRALLHQADQDLMQPFLDWLDSRPDVRLLGPRQAAKRAPTFALATDVEPATLIPRLAAEGVLAGAGNFYAVRLLDAMGLSAARGVLRLSLVHYNTPQDVARLIAALDKLL
ncbi:MAG: nitrogen fixation protein NifS [Xanthomonadaceae bacterium]|nr:nitrogen fixation protein NifS [Xanthomonadaceae bacterium]